VTEQVCLEDLEDRVGIADLEDHFSVFYYR